MQGKARILIVDDSLSILQSAAQSLRDDGHEVAITTHSVGNPVVLRAVELVLLDFHMPGHSGPAILASYKKAAVTAGSQPLFYMFTNDRAEAANARAHGFDGVLAAKGDPDALTAQVNAISRMIQLRKL